MVKLRFRYLHDDLELGVLLGGREFAKRAGAQGSIPLGTESCYLLHSVENRERRGLFSRLVGGTISLLVALLTISLHL